MERFGPTRRGGPVFRWLGQPLGIDLVNTVMVVREGEVVDLLATRDDLARWLEAERGRLGDCRFALEHHAEIRALRDAVRAVLLPVAAGQRPSRKGLEILNDAARAAPISRCLRIGKDGQLEAVATSARGGRLDQLLGALAHAAIDLVTDPESSRMRICQAPSCGMLFIGSRRWCCHACGNRARAARHYYRKRASRRALA
jgi:predicted RNA-binding Zn ribbon-like protein